MVLTFKFKVVEEVARWFCEHEKLFKATIVRDGKAHLLKERGWGEVNAQEL